MYNWGLFEAKIISEQIDFILDQCAVCAYWKQLNESTHLLRAIGNNILGELKNVTIKKVLKEILDDFLSTDKAWPQKDSMLFLSFKNEVFTERYSLSL